MDRKYDVKYFLNLREKTKVVVYVFPLTVIAVIAGFIFFSSENFIIDFSLTYAICLGLYWIYFFLIKKNYFNVTSPERFVPFTLLAIVAGTIFFHCLYLYDFIEVPVLYRGGVSVSFQIGVTALTCAAIYITAFASYFYLAAIHIAIKKEITENEKLRLRFELLQLQMNPHFIFNCLVNLNDTIRLGNKEQAIWYNNAIAKLLRLQLENSINDEIPLSKEIEFLRLYLEVELNRLPNLFKYSIVIENNMDLDDYKIPPQLLQAFVENSIKHAFLPSKDESSGMLQIAISERDAKGYTIKIYDNGKGVNADTRQKISLLQKSSIAIENIKERIKLLGKISPFSIMLYTAQDDEGYSIKIDVHYEPDKVNYSAQFYNV